MIYHIGAWICVRSEWESGAVIADKECYRTLGHIIYKLLISRHHWYQTKKESDKDLGSMSCPLCGGSSLVSSPTYRPIECNGALTPWRLGKCTPSVFQFLGKVGKCPWSFSHHYAWFVTLPGCPENRDMLWLEIIFEQEQNFFLVQRLSRNVVKRSQNVI